MLLLGRDALRNASPLYPMTDFRGQMDSSAGCNLVFLSILSEKLFVYMDLGLCMISDCPSAMLLEAAFCCALQLQSQLQHSFTNKLGPWLMVVVK